MYLTANLYVGGRFKHNEVKGNINIEAEGKTLVALDDLTQVSEIKFSAAYWRKANQIHAWFVENCQGGVDQCQSIWVSEEQLQELLDLCKTVLESKGMAVKLLPTVPGFFFGSTEVDEWYWQDIEDTVKQLEAALSNPLFERCSFYYQSSW